MYIYSLRTENINFQSENQRIVTVNDCQLQTENSSVYNPEYSHEIENLYNRLSAIEEVLAEKNSEITLMKELNESIIKQSEKSNTAVQTEIEGILKAELNMFDTNERNQKSIGKVKELILS